MSRNREGQWIQGNYIRPGGAQRSRVEISDDEDDEVTEIKQQSSSDTGCSDRTSRFRMRRQKREAAQEVKFSGDEEINEEWEQLQQVIKLSKLEAEKQEERRKMCGTLQDVMNLQVEIEPLNSSSLKNQNKRNKTAVGNERDQREDSASPELFSTPPEDQGISDSKVEEKVDSDAEFPDSPPLPVNMRSPDAGNSNDRQRKEQPSSTAQPSQQEKDTKRKFKLRRTRQEESSVVNKREKIGGDDEEDDDDDDDDAKVTVLENDKEKPQNENLEVDKNILHGEKRTLQSVINDDDDDDDVTDDEGPILCLRKRISLKRQKLTQFLEDSDSEDVKDVAKRGSKRTSDKLSNPIPKRVAVGDFDEEKTRKDESVSSKEKQNSSLSSALPPSVRFSREYKKPKYRPTTVKEIMKAEVYIAPPGFNIPSYTKLIIRMLDRYRKRLQIAQSKVKVRLPWGHPVVAGSNSKTLELRMPGKASVFSFLRGIPQDATGTSVKNNSDSDVSYKRRTLRSSAKLTTQAATSTSTSTTTHETSYKVDSDSDGDEFLKAYLDDVRPKPSVITSSKKASHLTKNDSSSASVSADQQNLRPKDDETSSVKKQMSSKSNLGLSNDGKTTKWQAKIKTGDTNISVQNGNSDVLFGTGVILDANTSELQSNTFGASVKSPGKDNNAKKDFKTSESKVKDKKEGTKELNQPDNQTNKGDAISMEVDENQADNIQPPKRRSILHSLDDDSTDDERDMSQPIVSLHRTKGDTSVDVDGSSSKEQKGSKLGESVVDADNVALLDSQSILTQSGSQENLGKSILDTLTTENQGVLEPELLSNNSLTKGFTSTTKRTVKREGDSLTIDLDSEDSQNVQQKRSEAADKAAAAAERRQRLLTRGQPPRDTLSSSSFAASSVNKDDAHKESTVECPLCYRLFPSSEIQTHASDCQGPPSPPPKASYSQTQREMAGTSDVTSPGPCAIYRTLSGERGLLKNLKVFLQRSPLAERKILEKANQPPESGKKNLDFEKNVSPSGQTGKIGKFKGFHQSSAEGARKHTRTTRAAVRTESESERSGYEREVDEEVCSWLDSSSPEKKRPQKTYGGNNSKPYGDYIPLETSRQSDDDRIIKSSSSKSHEENQTTRKDEIESCSSSSDGDDDALMVQYGAQRVSRRQKTGSRKEEKQETDENELALEQLGGWKKKRPLSSSKSSKPRKSRRLRDSDSEDSDESTILCAMCEERIPKEIYEKHAEEELEERKRKGGAPRKVEVVTAKDPSREGGRSDHRRVGRQEKRDLVVPLQSSGAECSEVDDNDDFDWDAVSDSPIKCFQFTENCTSGVDFQNQFEHLKKEKGGRRRGNQERYKGSDTRRGYGQYDNRGEYGSSGGGSNKKGHYRGSYNKAYGRGRRKKYSGKSRGYRGGKK